jgi:hypothetical protein
VAVESALLIVLQAECPDKITRTRRPNTSQPRFDPLFDDRMAGIASLVAPEAFTGRHSRHGASCGRALQRGKQGFRHEDTKNTKQALVRFRAVCERMPRRSVKSSCLFVFFVSSW